jgi:hypothetical protein
MDLGTLEKRVSQGFYENTYHFAAEMRLVWKNALAFNPGPETFVHKKALELSKLFEERFAVIPAVVAPKAVSAKRKASPAMLTDYNASSWESTVKKTKKRKTMTNRRATPPVNATNPAMMNHLKQMQAQIMALQKNGGGGGTGRKRTPVERKRSLIETPLQAREKMSLRTNITKMTPVQVQGLLKLLRFDSNKEDVTIDMDQMDIPTLRSVQGYVKKQLSLSSKMGKRRITSGSRRSSGHAHPRMSPGPLPSPSMGFDSLPRDPAPLPKSIYNNDDSDDSSDSDDIPLIPSNPRSTLLPFSSTFSNPARPS